MHLDYFENIDNFYLALKTLFEDLNIPVNYIAEEPARPQDILTNTFKEANPAFKLMEDVYFLGMVDDAAFEGNKSISADKIKTDYDGLLLFGVTLKERGTGLLPTRSHLAEITRAFNREFHYTPVVVVFRYNQYIAFANAERQKYKQEWREGEKAGKVSLLRDVKVNNPHTGHLKILQELAIARTGRNAVNSFDGLYKYWQSVFNVSVLNRKFYKELSNWYFWALKNVTFPGASIKADQNGLFKEDERVKEHNAKNLIRLLTRLLFVWFVKEKNLIPEELFDTTYIKEELLKEFQPQRLGDLFAGEDKGSKYYKAVLQNLFFATLNRTMGKREFRKDKQHMNVTTLMRYENCFKDPGKFIKLVEDIVPFMNGGLFECLDQPHETIKGRQGGDKIIYIDGFSDRKDNELFVPDYIFFGDKEHVDLSEYYGNKSKTYKSAPVKGLINILNSYKFTITENTPIEEDVALDPELLGRVFENLLASYNPETKTTARKQTGSFYTPREIVNYMVDESLIAYFKNKLSDIEDADELDTKLRQLISFDNIQPFQENKIKKKIIKAIDACSILDPACGSGAFPMGILQKMVHLLHKLDPGNERWKQRQIDKVNEAIEKAEEIEDSARSQSVIKELKEQIRDIEDSFENNELDYGRKLYLLENCIYGVDIQEIATQISKLRFFISLIVDQSVAKNKENFGIRPLPNLETKFVAANTLIGIEKPEKQGKLFDNPEIKKLEDSLKKVRHKIFSSKSPGRKRELRNEDKTLRKQISELLIEGGWGNKTARQLASWDPYDQNASSPFFDPEWMFGIGDGFDVVIGNPPYVEARNSKLFPEFFKKQYQHNVQLRWKAKSRYISRGVDLLIYFFEFSLKQLKANGINTFITQNAWLSTDYGKKFQDFLLSLDLSIKIDDSNLKHFDSNDGPNINTVISFFENEKVEKKIRLSSVDISRSKGTKLVSDEKYYDSNDNILNYKWGTLLKSPDFILKLFRTITENGNRKDYLIGQGLNITQAHFITQAQIKKFTISPDILLPIMTSNDGAPFVLTETSQYIVNPQKINASQRKELNRNGIDVCKLSNNRYIPSLILPRGLGRYFAALNNISAYSASFVEVYVIEITQSLNNIWLFLNSTIGYIIREITGRTNLGGGMLKAEATDLKYFNLNHKFKNENEIARIIKLAINIESKSICNLLNLELHKKIDDIVFSRFGVENAERLLIVEYLKELVTKRENKSKT